MMRILRAFVHWFLVFGLLAVLLYLAAGLARQPPHTTITQPLFQGVDYERRALTSPRPLMLHIVAIDRANPDLSFIVTPPDRLQSDSHLDARKTTQFVEEFGVQLAINGSFFYPFVARGPLNYYPHVGDPVTTVGLTISDGVEYSPDDDFFDVVCFSAESPEAPTRQAITISRRGCPPNTLQALSGNQILINAGRAIHLQYEPLLTPYPRTVLAYNDETLWLLLADGKQGFYSEGATLPELTNLLLEMGAQHALNLDGGGSVSLVVDTGDGPQLLNSPAHTRIPMRERPIANHFGIYAKPLD